VTEFGALLAALNRAQISYVVIGGLAVGANGYVRATRDLDVLVPADAETMSRLRTLLAGLEGTLPDGSPLPDELFDGEHHVRATTVHGLLDVLPEGESELSYESVAEGAIEAEIDGTPTKVAGLKQLVLMKRLSGRPQDLEDIRRLEIAHGTLPEIGPDS